MTHSDQEERKTWKNELDGKWKWSGITLTLGWLWERGTPVVADQAKVLRWDIGT